MSFHRVRPGDYLSRIAQQHGLSLQAVVRANPQIKNINLIYPGQLINLPGSRDSFEPARPKPKPSPPSRPQATQGIGNLPRSSSPFINSIARGAVEADRRYGVPASVTIAQAILESGWGKSGLAARDNNLFGIKGRGPAGSAYYKTKEWVNGRYITITAAFRKYNSKAESMVDHGKLLATSRYYEAAMAVRNNARAFAQKLQGVYATSPTYAKNLINIMNQYNLYAYDRA